MSIHLALLLPVVADIALHLPTVANKQASRSQPVEQHRTNNSA